MALNFNYLQSLGLVPPIGAMATPSGATAPPAWYNPGQQGWAPTPQFNGVGYYVPGGGPAANPNNPTTTPATVPLAGQIAGAFAQRHPVLAAAGDRARAWTAANPQLVNALGAAGSNMLLAAGQATGGRRANTLTALGAGASAFQQAMQPADTTDQWRQLTPDEVQARNLDPNKQWQIDPNGQIKEIGGSGVQVSLNTVPDLSPTMEQAALDAINEAGNRESQNIQLEQMLNLIQTTPTGWVENATLGFRNMLVSLGVIDDPNLPAQQVLQAMGNVQALLLRNPASGYGLTGNTTDADRNFLVSSIPGLMQTQEANAIIATLMIAKNRRDAELAYLRAQTIYQDGDLRNWQQVQQDYIDSHPYLNDQETSVFMTAMGAQQATDPRGQTFWVRADNSGNTIYFDPQDGGWHRLGQ